jgi:hypothetical protein
MRSSLLAPVDLMEFQTTEACSSLDLTRVKYGWRRHSRDDKGKATQQSRPHNLVQNENMWWRDDENEV